MMQGWKNWPGLVEVESPYDSNFEFVDARIVVDPNTLQPKVVLRVTMPLTPDMELNGHSYCVAYAEELLKAKIK